MSTGVDNGGAEAGTARRYSPRWAPPPTPPARPPHPAPPPYAPPPAPPRPPAAHRETAAPPRPAAGRWGGADDPLPPGAPHDPYAPGAHGAPAYDTPAHGTTAHGTPAHGGGDGAYAGRPAPARTPFPDAPRGPHAPAAYRGPAPGAGRPAHTPPSPAYRPRSHRPAARRHRLAAALAAVLGIGLLAGAIIGTAAADPAADEETAAERAARMFEMTRELWHNIPVDSLFPLTLDGAEAGPGGADRVWTRIGVQPDGDCRRDEAFDPALARVLAPAGCEQLLRATYTDAASSSVTTVGLLVTEADQPSMRELRSRWTRDRLGERADLMPRPLAVDGTVAAGFGDGQRASWTVRVRQDVPYVIFAVSGFADCREVGEPVPAEEAAQGGSTAPPAEAGLGNDAEGIETQIAKGLTDAARHMRTAMDSAEGRNG